MRLKSTRNSTTKQESWKYYKSKVKWKYEYSHKTQEGCTLYKRALFSSLELKAGDVVSISGESGSQRFLIEYFYDSDDGPMIHGRMHVKNEQARKRWRPRKVVAQPSEMDGKKRRKIHKAVVDGAAMQGGGPSGGQAAMRWRLTVLAARCRPLCECCWAAIFSYCHVASDESMRALGPAATGSGRRGSKGGEGSQSREKCGCSALIRAERLKCTYKDKVATAAVEDEDTSWIRLVAESEKGENPRMKGMDEERNELGMRVLTGLSVRESVNWRGKSVFTGKSSAWERRLTLSAEL
ncbi:hypothetical protein AXG93_2018s1150 [Marchantia polymorpha subsp. ruderalis]|uniref:Uncharacterized protein n=1 Tax=Marchantia polymorpha subsp. ruderalis TaxID=1480154 RepID=A0A176WCJ9_MARPO|nr:hypothetical protein AXG93_2018s1150 [Marchantia polymorpha subsp. ruderalis]